MSNQRITINNNYFFIPDYYQKVDSMPGDPEGSVPYMVQTKNAMCFAMIFPIDASQAMPKSKEALISGIRQYLEENQGLIQVEAGEDHVYSIVKTLKEEGGVQYTLTYHKFFPDGVVNIQGFFDEIGITGLRDNIAYEMCRSLNLVGNDDDPLAGWARDPYDENYKKGALMNLSELEEFDEQFPGSALSMCRELVKIIEEA